MSEVGAHASDSADAGGGGLAAGGAERPRLSLRLQQDRFATHLTLRDVLVSAFHFKRILAIVFLVPVLIGAVVAWKSPSIYVADERLLVLLGSEYVYQAEVGAAGTGHTLDRNQIMQGELEILQSEALRTATLRALGVAAVYPDLDSAAPPVPSARRDLMEKLEKWGLLSASTPDDPAAAEAAASERLRRNLAITSVPQTNVIQMTYRTTNQEMSARVLNTLVAQYLQRRDEVFRRPRTDSDVQDKEYAQRLRDAEAALMAFSDAHQIASFDEQMSRLLDQQASTSREQQSNEQAIGTLTAQVRTLEAQLAGIPQTVELYAETERAPTAAGSAEDLVRLESERRTMASRYQPNSPQIAEIDRRLARARSDAAAGRQLEAKGVRRGQNPQWLGARTHLEAQQVELQGALARRAELAQSLAAINSRIRELTDAGTQYRDLRRNRDVLAETFAVYAHNREEARLSDALDRGKMSNIRVVQAATPPATGSAQRGLLLGGGLAIGLLLMAATLAMLNALRQVMLTPEEVERELQLPVLLAVNRARSVAVEGAKRSGMVFNAQAMPDPHSGRAPGRAANVAA